MTRRSILTTALISLTAFFLPRRSEAATHLPNIPRKVAEPAPVPSELIQPFATDRPHGHETGGILGNVTKLSGVSLPFVSVWCQCPNCNGKGFVGGEDNCGYCRAGGSLKTAETFRMFSSEGDAEVFRALAWHEWSLSNYWREDKGPKPFLAGMLYCIGQQHPEVYDTAVREAIFSWLENRFDRKHAQEQARALFDYLAPAERQEAREKLRGRAAEAAGIGLPYVDMGGTHRLEWMGRDGKKDWCRYQDWQYFSKESAEKVAEICRKDFPSMNIVVVPRPSAHS